MGLAYRVIPTLLCRGRELVKGKRFNAWRSVGVASQAVRIHQARGVDEIILLDIAATPEGRGPDLDLVRELTAEVFCPLTVGGGVKGLSDVRALLRAGADKVVIGTGGPLTISEAAKVVGSQAIVASLDVRAGHATVRCGTVTTRQTALGWARSCWEHGAGEILLTSIEREGTMKGYDLDLIRDVSHAVSIPVIAHGGAGSYEHMSEALDAGASAVAAGALFQFTEGTPSGAANFLAKCGYEMRL